jgi:hypothetical protein
MSRRHSRWQRVLVPLLALALGPVPAHSAEPSKYLPGDTELVVYINVRQILDAPLVKKYGLERVKAALKESTDAQKFITGAGLDPLKDVQSLLMASPGSAAAAEKVLVVARGRFQLDKINTAAEEFAKSHPDQLKVSTVDGLRLYEGRSKKDNSTAYLVFPDQGTLLLSPSRQGLLEALQGRGEKGSRVSKELQAYITKADDSQSAWIVGRASDELKKALAGNPQTAGIADKLVAFSGHVVVSDGVEAAIHIYTKDPRTAESVSRLLDGVKGIVAFAASQNNEEYGDLISDVIDAFKITSDKTTVTLSVKISESLIEKGLKKEKK